MVIHELHSAKTDQRKQEKGPCTSADFQLVLIKQKHTLKYTFYRNVVADTIAAKHIRIFKHRIRPAVVQTWK